MKSGCLVGMGVSVLGLIIPAASAAACEVSLTGHFVIDQTGTPNLQWDLVQDRNGAVTGSVIFSGGTGTVSGSVSHNNRGADLVVTWKAGGRGRYTWTINQDGRMVSGQTVALDHPTPQHAALSSSSSFCQ